MVRAGVVTHPSEWPFGGYHEIQTPKRKCVLIAHQKLIQLTGFTDYDTFRRTHQDLVNESIGNGNNHRKVEWTESIAVGSQNFIKEIKGEFGFLAKGRKIIEKEEAFLLREEKESYNAVFEGKKENIGAGNSRF